MGRKSRVEREENGETAKMPTMGESTGPARPADRADQVHPVRFVQAKLPDRPDTPNRSRISRPQANTTEALTMKLSAVQPSQPLPVLRSPLRATTKGEEGRRSRPRYGVFGEGEYCRYGRRSTKDADTDAGSEEDTATVDEEN